MNLLQQLRRLSDDVQPAWHADDRRVETRAWSLRIRGKLTVNGDERPCQISDISSTGLRIETRDLPLPGQRVWIEARGFDAAPAVVVWNDGLRAGLSFETIQDPGDVLALQRHDLANQPRDPRFKLHGTCFRAPLYALLEGPHGTSRLEVADISLGGIKLRGKTEAIAGQRGLVRLSHADSVAGEVRWRKANFLGFNFAQPMPSETLFGVLAGKDYALTL